MSKQLVSDELWGFIEPLLPVRTRRFRNPGRKRLPDRACLAGIFFVLKTGIPWEDLPQEMGCGSGMTCWRRLEEWQRLGVWDRIHRVLLGKLRKADALDLSRAVVDSASIRAVGGASKRVRTQRIGANRAPNTTSSPMPRASHWRRSSPAPIATT